jgi:hypothetical protein
MTKTPTVAINRENQTVNLYGFSPYEPYSGLDPYEIDLDRIKTERDLLAWALHLTEKSWMTCSGLNHFITTVGEYKKFKIYGT